MNKTFITFIVLSLSITAKSQKVDFSVVSVPEEAELNFLQITQAKDYVCMPTVKRNSKRIDWYTNHIIDISADNKDLAYLSYRNNTTNIFIKSIDKLNSSIQRTNRKNVLDFSYSPDGKNICFSEKNGKTTQIFQTNAKKGYICRQITNNNKDYTPIYTNDASRILFSRQESNSISIWCYDIEGNFLSSCTTGMNPCPTNENNTIICSRQNNEGRNEIWKINYEEGTEELIISDTEKSFTSPRISPDGNWIIFVGSSKISTEDFTYWNTDIYASLIDGTKLTQITYHAADDLSPIWSKDGNYIYFISQRGSAEGSANIWRIQFSNKE